MQYVAPPLVGGMHVPVAQTPTPVPAQRRARASQGIGPASTIAVETQLPPSGTGAVKVTRAVGLHAAGVGGSAVQAPTVVRGAVTHGVRQFRSVNVDVAGGPQVKFEGGPQRQSQLAGEASPAAPRS
jgi:hypothetical protein